MRPTTAGKAIHTDRQANDETATVLVVEDEALIRFVTADELRAAGFRVLECTQADIAAQVLRDHQEIAAVVTDIRTPGSMDGNDLARLVRQEYPATKIVLVSGNRPDVGPTEHDGYFCKPLMLPLLVSHVRGLLAKGNKGH